MSFKCPKCHRDLANRRRPTCSYCGSPIPASLRMPDSAQTKLDELRAAEAKAHRDYMEKPISTGGDAPYIPDIPDIPGSF